MVGEYANIVFTSEKVFFTNSKGYRLAGVLNFPRGLSPFPAVVFSHGFDSSKESPTRLSLSIFGCLAQCIDHGLPPFLTKARSGRLAPLNARWSLLLLNPLFTLRTPPARLIREYLNGISAILAGIYSSRYISHI